MSRVAIGELLRRREPQVVALAPVPDWVPELAGVPVERAAAWATDANVTIRMTVAEGWLLIEHVAGQGWFRVSGRDRRPMAHFASHDRAQRFVERLRWIGGVRNEYTPSPAESAVHGLCSELARARDPNATGRIAARAASAPRDVRLYLELSAGRWPADSGEGDRPGWLVPITTAISGDFDALRQLATRGVDDGPLANVVGMAFELVGFHDAARAAYEKGVESVFGAERADVCLELSKLGHSQGDGAAAVRWARSALLIHAPSDALLVRACAELVRNAAFDDAYLVLRERCEREPFERDLALALAELLLWAGRADPARAWLERAGGDDFRANKDNAILLALDGRWADAAGAMSRAIELRPGDGEVATWLAELQLRLGAREDAARWLAKARIRSQSAVHVALSSAIHGINRGELATLLAAHGISPPEREDESEATTRAALELLSSFGGNRGELLTRPRRDVEGLGLDVVARPANFSIRDAAAATIKCIGIVPLPELERRFEELSETYPNSAHPLCFWGELELWLGEYDRAIQLFERALSREPARWAYVGKAAALVLRGDYAGAEAEIEQCERWFTPVLGATTPVYVGEAYRRRGDHAQAREQLRTAVEAKPGRAGAWMNLALTELALGAEHEAARIFDMLQARLPRLYVDAWFSLSGERRWPIPSSELGPLFERALEMMRGNRSSHTITYFDASGSLRIAQSTERWLEPLARHAPFIAMDLRRRLALGLVHDDA